MIKNVVFPFDFFSKKLCLLIIIISFKNLNNETIPNFQVFYLYNNMYVIIDAQKIYLYTSENRIEFYSFNQNQKITSADESEMISLAKFKDADSVYLTIVKKYIYAYFAATNFGILENEQINNYKSEIFPLKYNNNEFYYIVGIVNSEQELVLYLYKNKVSDTKCSLIFTFSISNINSENFSCQLMQSPSFGEVLTCFYENNNNEIVANSLTIDTTNSKIESAFNRAKSNNGANIIKSKLSQDETKSYVCYINNDNNCDCLTYMVVTNEWSDYTTYINSCLSKRTTLFLDYYEFSNEYFLYCYETETKINILKLNENFGIVSGYSNDTYDYIKSCSTYYLSSLIYSSNEDITIFGYCKDKFNNYLIGKFQNISTTILTTLPETTITTTFPEITIPTKTTIITTISETTIPAKNAIITTIPETPIPTTAEKMSITISLPFISSLIDNFEE